MRIDLVSDIHGNLAALEAVAADILEKTASGWLVEHRCIPCDHESMAALAKLRACPDWEFALLHGRAK